MEVIRAGLKNLNSPAIVSESVITRYHELLRSSLRVSEILEKHATVGDKNCTTNAITPRIAVMADPGPCHVAGTMGTWLHQGIAVPLGSSHPDRSLQYMLEDAGVSSILACANHAERMYQLAKPFGADVHILDPMVHPKPQHATVNEQAGGDRTIASTIKESISNTIIAHGGDDGGGGTASRASDEPASSSNGSGSEEEQARAEEGQHRVEAAAAVTKAAERLMGGELTNAIEEHLGRLRGEDGALLIYTSGTTGNPKGALHTHGSIMAQVRTLCRAWCWESSDRILHSLPLHHIHGLVNALYCPLYSGATVEFMPHFSPGEVWSRLMRKEDPVTVFMGVPTMYSFLLNKHSQMDPQEQAAAGAAAGDLRLAVSGSSACPTPLMEQWEQLSGQKLLERYGMTETGMILGNPYQGGERRQGTVGVPFPGLDVKLVGREGDPPGVGEVRVKGEQLFKEYWGKPEATLEAFDEEGYFVTGDVGQLSGTPPYYSLLGRSSVDIIKHGGYKLSALQIESALLEHPSLQEAAVVGVPEDEYGEAVCALAVLKPGSGPLDLPSLREWARDRLAPYQLPSHLVLLEALPRNAMGKVNKKELRQQMAEGALP